MNEVDRGRIALVAHAERVARMNRPLSPPWGGDIDDKKVRRI